MAHFSPFKTLGLSSLQGLLSGVAIGFFGPPAFPLLIASVPLDLSSLRPWRQRSKAQDPAERMRFTRMALLGHGVNLVFSVVGIVAMSSYSPMGDRARQQYFKVIATPAVGSNVDSLSREVRQLLNTEDSYWLSSDQKARLTAKQKTLEGIRKGARDDQALLSEGAALAGLKIDKGTYESFLSRASEISRNPRATVVLSGPVRARIAQSTRDSLALAESIEKQKEADRISRLPKKYNATMTNCFVDAPCESFERVAVVADGKVTVGDFTCLIAGQGPDDQGYGACSVAMDGGRPVSMRQWDPKDGFETTRVSFGAQVKDGTYDPEKEANPYVKLQRERVAEILQEWEREKENARKNCKGLRGDAWTACAGAQSGN